jgi:hypothetical protein
MNAKTDLNVADLEIILIDEAEQAKPEIAYNLPALQPRESEV